MKRTTINLPDDLAALLDHERRVRDVSAATIVREALEQYLASGKTPRRIPFAAIGESDGRESIAANAEEILAREWGSEEGQNRLMYGTPYPGLREGRQPSSSSDRSE